jgi:hypothetical protein
MRKFLVAVLAAEALAVALAQGWIYQMDHNPLGQWRGDRELKSQLTLLKGGGPEQRMNAAFFLGTVGFGREDVRQALHLALRDSNPTVAAEATLGLRFGFHERIEVTKETFQLANLRPRA